MSQPRARPLAPRLAPLVSASVATALLAGAPRIAPAQTGWQPAAGHVQIPLWPAGPPNAPPSVGPPSVGPEAVHEAVEPGTTTRKLVGGTPYIYVENVSRPTITVYAPTARPTGAAVIVYPGGGFSVLAMDIEGTEACAWLNGLGITCVLLKYRVPCAPVGAYRDCPTAHEDAQRAMRLVRAHARDWRLDPNRIGVMGFSAGAHMAIISSTRFESRYTRVDGADTLSSRPDFALVLYPGRVVYRRTHFAPNPDITVTERTPPTFLVHAYDDDVNPVENSLIYATALRRAGVPAEVHVFATGGHAFGLRRTAVPATGWTDLAAAWLRGIGITRE